MIFRALFLVFITIAFPAMAAEPLYFHKGIKDIREEQVIADLTAQNNLLPDVALEMARFDLNGDGVVEWIIRQNPTPTCAAESACRFTVAGLREKKPFVLGAFSAGKVGISSEKLYGVRKLLVYNKKNDDFAYSEYVWDPHKGHFTPE